MNWKNVFLVLGLLAAMGGLAIAFVPALEGLIESPTSVPFALAITALATALVRVRTWLGHEEHDYQPHERERPTGIGAPGESFDERLARAPGRATGGNTRLIMIRQSLRETAIDTLTTYHGHTPESARRALNSGTWSDDQYAVEFFTTTGGSGNSLSESVTSSFYGDAPFHRRADSAAREIEQLSRGER